MSENRPLDEYDFHAATHQERASVYISDSMTGEDIEAAIDMASSFLDKDKPTAKTAVLIPVAAHQDGDNIIPTLREYAQQKTDKPFTVFLHLNAPLDTADTNMVDDAEANVNMARKLFPDLDVRSSTTYYDRATIGRIRRDLWNAAFLLAYHEHGFSSDVIGINNDIDTHRVSPHYISRVQEHYEKRAIMCRGILGDRVADRAVNKPAVTRVTHAVLPSHPNTGKVTTWVDNTYFQSPGHVGYEAGLVIPFSHYASQSGFNEKSKTHETSWVSPKGRSPYISGAQLYTSPRRFIDRLHEHDTSKIWTEDSFGNNDVCRETLSDDISTERAEEVIFERLQSDIMRHWLHGAMDPIYRDMELKNILGKDVDIADTISAATVKVEKQLAKAERLLRKVVGSAILADLLRESCDARSYAETQVTSIHLLYAAFNGLDADNLTEQR